MACPQYGILEETLSFNIVCTGSNGSPRYADDAVTYTVYEQNTDNPILGLVTLTMTKDQDNLGIYYAEIDIVPLLFQKYRNYIIVINATVESKVLTKTYTFICAGKDEINASIGDTRGDIRAVTDKKGNFKQGDWGVLMLKLTDFDGTPVEVEGISISIERGSSPVEFDSYIPMQVDEGCFVYQWEIEKDQEIGEYIVTWTFNIEGTDYYELQSIFINTGSDTASANILFDERIMAFRNSLENMITSAQHIPVYFEQAKSSRDNKKFYFTFPRWNQSNKTKIYRNGKIVNEGYEVNYFKGSVTFDNPLLSQETINADYDFRWFSDDEIDQFLNNAIQEFNSYPPFGNYSLRNVPTQYMSVVLYGAAKNALRSLMMDLMWQEPQQVFGGLEGAEKAFSHIETLKQNYEKDWDKLTEQKKYGRYPKIGMVVVPEYTLPGGRSRWFRYLFK